MQRPIELSKTPRVAAPKIKLSSPLNRLDITRKLALSALAFAVPIAALGAIYLGNRVQDLNFTQGQLVGVDVFPAYQELQTGLQAYVDAKNQKREKDMVAAAAQVEAAFTTLRTQANVNGFADFRSTLGVIETEWEKLQKIVPTGAGLNLTDAMLDLTHQHLDMGLTTLLSDTKLILDPEAATYFAINSSLYWLPQARTQLANMDLLAETLERAGNDPALIAELKSHLREEAEHTNVMLGEAVNSARFVQAAYAGNNARTTAAIEQVQQIQALLDGIGATHSAGKTVSPESFEKAGAALLGGVELGRGEVRRLLQERMTRYRTSLVFEFGLSMLITLLAAALVLAISRGITRPLRQLSEAANKLGQGDLNISLPVTSADELGVLTGAFNDAASQLRHNDSENRQRALEAERLQTNIGAFLDVTMDIAEGDLTKRGKVTDDVLGNVVDSINLMTDELGQTLRGVQNASASVKTGSRAMLSTTEQITQGAELTAAEMQRISERVAAATEAIRVMAVSAQTSAQTARQALDAATQGQQAVEGTLEGMQNVRREVQGVAKSIKGLGDRSLEIQEIVDTISQIAEQTHLLAVNASIEAAGAGQAGGRFSIVADAVRKLSDTSNQATARVATLIKNVQSEIQDVIVRVEESTLQVEQGYRVAGNAGQRLNEIGQLTEQTAQLAEQIAQSSQEQAQGIEQMSQAVQQVTRIAQDSNTSVVQGRAAAEQLEQLAQQLSASLSRFRLPGGTSGASGPSGTTGS